MRKICHLTVPWENSRLSPSPTPCFLSLNSMQSLRRQSQVCRKADVLVRLLKRSQANWKAIWVTQQRLSHTAEV